MYYDTSPDVRRNRDKRYPQQERSSAASPHSNNFYTEHVPPSAGYNVMRSAQSILINVDGAVLKAVEALYDKKGKPRAGVSSDDDLGDYLSLDLLKKTSAEILDTLAMHMVHEESRRAVLAVAIAMISNLSGESPYVWIHGALCRAGKTSTECERVESRRHAADDNAKT
jgi:hypothetical protein